MFESINPGNNYIPPEIVRYFDELRASEEPFEESWKGPGWYFYDETYTYCYGPYETKELANIKLNEYCDYLNEQ